jgi:hypothetical protein
MATIGERIKEFNDKLIDDIDKLRRVLPLTRGGKATTPRTESRKPRPIPTSPAPPGDEVRFRPTEPFRTEPRVQDYPQFNLPPLPGAVKQVTPIEVIEEVINNPAVQLTEDMLPAINDPGVFMRNGELFGQFSRANLLRTKKKRKVSKYQKEFGRQLKLLKKKHPRIPVTRLMKRAHAATRKALK